MDLIGRVKPDYSMTWEPSVPWSPTTPTPHVEHGLDIDMLGLKKYSDFIEKVFCRHQQEQLK